MQNIVQTQIEQAQRASRGRWGLSLSPDNPYIYNATFIPSNNSIYHYGVFNVQITIPLGYPMYPPRVTMITKIFHPNISEDGRMYVELLYGDYKPTLSILDLMEYIYSLFTAPDSDDLSQCNYHASELYKRNIEQFKSIAKDWVKKYAQ